MTEPLITVLSSKMVAGLSVLTDAERAQPCASMSVDAAMATLFDTDAHFVCYVLMDGDKPAAPQFRVNKSALASIEARGGRIELRVFALDIDNPGHLPWTPDLIADFDARCAQIPDEFKPRFIYRSKNGARFVFPLTEPCSPLEAEPRIRGLVGLFAQFGFKADVLADWTRLFRLPMVMRDGAPTVDDFSFFVGHDPSAPLLDWRSIPAVESGLVSARRDVSDIPDPSRDPMPTPEECRLMVGDADASQTDLGRRLRARLVGRGVDEILHGIPPPEGSRDSRMMSVIGLLCRMLYGHCEPKHVFALLLPATEQMTADAQHPNWVAWLWNKVAYSWRNVVADEGPVLPDNHEKHPELDEAPTSDEFQAVAVARAVAKWCKDPVLQDPTSEAAQLFVKRIAAVCVNNKHYHVLRRDGYYDSHAVTIEHLANELLRHGWGEVFKLEFETKDGTRPATQGELLKQLMVRHVARVEGFAAREGDTLRGIDSNRLLYDEGLYSLRKDLPAEWSDEVDEWMTAMVGEDQIDDLRRWIGYALDFTEPICMLALLGARGAGKTFMMMGFADCLASPETAISGEVLMTAFPEKLLNTPFAEIAEALPKNGANDAARDRLRQMIGGSAINLNRKNRAWISAHTFLRVAITANNDVPLRQLSDNESSPDDIKAIMQRVLVLSVREEGVRWLEERGGKDYTRTWVSDGGAQETDFKLAKHFLALYEMRHQWPRGKRFLVEGQGYGTNSKVEATLEGSEANLEVAKAICDMLDQHDKTTIRGLSIGKDVAVTTQCVLDWVKRPGQRSDLGPHSAGSQLRLLSDRFLDGHSRDTTDGRKSVKSKWWILDLPKLLHKAQEYGWPQDFLAARVGMLGDDGAVPHS